MARRRARWGLALVALVALVALALPLAAAQCYKRANNFPYQTCDMVTCGAGAPCI